MERQAERVVWYDREALCPFVIWRLGSFPNQPSNKSPDVSLELDEAAKLDSAKAIGLVCNISL